MNKNDGGFQIKFDDGTNFVGNLFNKDWRNIPDTKEIKNIVFTYGGRPIKMENFREYNLTMEIHSVFGKQQKIANITLVGRADNHSILIIYNFKTGKLIRKQVTKYKEYGDMIVSTWKKGINNGVPQDYHG